MASTSTSLTEIPWYQRRTSGMSHLAPLPVRAKILLYVAIFALFSVFGFYSDLTYCHGRAPAWAVIVTALINGAYAMLYPYVLIHKPKACLYPVIAGSMILGPLVNLWLNLILVHQRRPAPGMIFDAQGVMLGVVISYSCFIWFTRSQASSAFRLQNELDLAHGIQRTLVPPIHLSHGGYDLNGMSLPSDKVGGDLVDVVVLPKGGIVAYVADVSGHGLQAGILMGMVKTAARTILLEEFTDPKVLLNALCDRLNRALPGVKEPHMYCTLAAIHLGDDGTVHYALAGHPAILHYAAADHSVSQLWCNEFPVGLLPVGAFITQQTTLERGDLLLVTTDGILEACNAQDEEFGADRLAALTDGLSATASLEDLSKTITTSVQAFGKQVDDQTLLIVRRQLAASLLPGSIEASKQTTAVA